MDNRVQDGKVIEYSNSGSAISSGDVVVLDQRIGIAKTDIAASTGKGSVELEGVFELTSDTGTAYAQGDRLFWDVSNSRLTKTGTGNVPAGMAFAAKLTAGTTARVQLTPHPKQAAKVADASAGSAAEINALRDALIAAGLMKNA